LKTKIQEGVENKFFKTHLISNKKVNPNLKIMRDRKHFDLKLDYNFLLLKYVPNLERSPLPAAEGWLLG
jgi:hypothetical protein